MVGEPAVVVGNSLGGYTCLLAAAQAPQEVSGVVLVNSAGRFSEPQAAVETALQDDASIPLRDAVQEAAQPADSSQLVSALDRWPFELFKCIHLLPRLDSCLLASDRAMDDWVSPIMSCDLMGSLGRLRPDFHVVP